MSNLTEEAACPNNKALLESGAVGDAIAAGARGGVKKGVKEARE